MTIFGTPIETIYLIVLIVSGSLTVLYILFGDVLHGIGEVLNFLHPTLVLAFLTFFSVCGYVLEMVSPLSSILIIVISVLVSLLLDTLLNLFILIPMASAEESLAYTEESLKGRVGKTIITIPENGFGEVVIENNSGTIAKPAQSYRNDTIEEGMQVLIIEVKNGVLYVVRYENHQLQYEKE